MGRNTELVLAWTQRDAQRLSRREARLCSLASRRRRRRRRQRSRLRSCVLSMPIRGHALVFNTFRDAQHVEITLFSGTGIHIIQDPAQALFCNPGCMVRSR